MLQSGFQVTAVKGLVLTDRAGTLGGPPLEEVRPSRCIGRHRGMANGTGVGCLGVKAAVLFRKVTGNLVSGGLVAGPAGPYSFSGPRILQGLVVIDSDSAGNHGVRAGMAAGTIDAAVAGRITVQIRLGIYLRNTGVAGYAGRLINPRYPSVFYRGRDV